MTHPFGRGPGAYELAFEHPDRLNPNSRNARSHSKKQVQQIADSINQDGWTNPILVDENFNIIAGHGRLLAAKLLKLTSVPIIILRGLTDLQKRRLRLADNKIALNSGWDVELLKLELQELSVEMPDLQIPGFEAGEIDSILSADANVADDQIPAVPQVPVTRLGDTWVFEGRHRVGCFDCRDKSLLEQLMADTAADAAFIDAPYNTEVDGHVGGNGKIKHREFAFASGEMTQEEFIVFLREALGAAVAVSRDGAVHFLCMDHHHVDELIEACRPLYGARLNICVWNKSNAGMGSLYRSKHELIFVYRVGDAQHFNAVQLGKHGRNRTNVWDAPSVNTVGSTRSADLSLHPTVKPAGLVANAIMDVTRRGDAVLDVFLGSGTTLIACERTGRVCFGVEIDPIYVDVAIERFFLATGKWPVLDATGEPFEDVRAQRAAGKGASDE